MFIYFGERERETEHKQGRDREREGGTESKAGSRLRDISTELDAGLEIMNREIMAWAEVGSLTNWATQVPQEYSVLLAPNLM